MSRIMFAGPSGIGKTTMAQIVSRDYEDPKVSKNSLYIR